MTLTTLILSAIFGLAFGLLFPPLFQLGGETPLPESTGLMAGLLSGTMFFALLTLMTLRLERRRKAAAEKLPSPPTHTFRAILMGPERLELADVHLCEAELCLIAVDKRDMPITTYPGQEIVRAHAEDGGVLKIVLTENRELKLRTGEFEALQQALGERGWLPLQS